MGTPITPRQVVSALASSLLACSVASHAQQAEQPAKPRPPSRSAAQSAPNSQPPIEALQRQLAEQRQLLDNLRTSLGQQDARYQELQRELSEVRAQQQGQQRAASPHAAAPAAGAGTTDSPARAPNDGRRAVRVGSAPVTAEAPQAMAASLFEQPGVLTPRGDTIVEPSLQYGYSSSNRVALVGYTVIPSLLIGLVDVREVKRNTWIGALTLRHGLTNRLEVETKIPYVHRSDSTVTRELFTGTAAERAFFTSGRGVGDIEFSGRYQLTDGGLDRPYLIGSLRFKSRTGKDPFDVTTDCVTRCVDNTTGTGQPLELPTGSGFYMLQPGLTWLYPSDPAVFFGSVTYGYNFKRSGLSRQVLGSEREFIGDIKPGDIIGVNFGMGLALNDKSSFSVGIDLSSIGRTKQNGVALPGSVRTQLASLMLGYSFRYSESRTVGLSVGAGMTRDTPDLTLNVRIPFTF